MTANYLKHKSLCPLPFAGAIVNPDGSVQCCSVSKEYLGNVKDQPLEEILKNNTKLKQIRRDMLDNKFPYNCTDCYVKEKYNKKKRAGISRPTYKK